ncbi:MAG: Fe-S protein assembly co-chaperone HscB [Methylotenera sp.]|nr:Fe-S protein assembly co-chaperone HscB [Methylotenera sp.]
MSLNYFQLFDLPETFAIALSTLETQYRKLQASAHPDRYVTATASIKLQSMQLATLANEAYLTLKNPAKRAQYLLRLKGIDSLNESNTNMPMDFLMQQMQWRESLEEASVAKDINTLDALHDEMQAESAQLSTALIDLMDSKKDYAAASETTRKLVFIDKVCADIQQAIERLD